MRKIGLCLVSIVFIGFVYARMNWFSCELISGPLFANKSDPMTSSVESALLQPYHYLGKGRQAFAFVSADGNWVVKFFNQRYHKIPFYAIWNGKEQNKREKRKNFYLSSYLIAAQRDREETGICYLHLGPSVDRLPILSVADQWGHVHHVDLNQVPFVLQQRAASFYATLRVLDMHALQKAFQNFFSLVAARIADGIQDADHDVEHNFGFCHGRVIQLDPGRLYYEKGTLDQTQAMQQWWSSTHRLRLWLQKNRPESIDCFDDMLFKFQSGLRKEDESCY